MLSVSIVTLPPDPRVELTDDQLETEDEELEESKEPEELDDIELEFEFHGDCPKKMVLEVSGIVDVAVPSLQATCPWLQWKTPSALPLAWLKLSAWPVPTPVPVFQLKPWCSSLASRPPPVPRVWSTWKSGDPAMMSRHRAGD